MVLTYKQKFNKKYGFKKDEPHNLKEISQISDYKYSGIKTIFEKGEVWNVIEMLFTQKKK